jgi:hypothetical protein
MGCRNLYNRVKISEGRMEVNNNPDPDFELEDYSGTEEEVEMFVEEMDISVGDFMAGKDGEEPFEVIDILEYGEIRTKDFHSGYVDDISVVELYYWWRQGEVIPMKFSLTPK